VKKEKMKKLVGLGIIATIITAVFTAMVGMSMNTSGIEKDIVGDFAMPHEYSKAISNDCSLMSCCAINHWGLINVEKGETQQIYTELVSYFTTKPWLTIYCTEGSISITAEGETYDISAGQSITFHLHLSYRETVDVTGAGKGYYRISYCCIEGVP